MKKVLLHICCGVCALDCVGKLKREGFSVRGFFFNPNIHPFEEYEKRKKALMNVKEDLAIPIIEGEYNPDFWFDLCKKYAKEEEGGSRCAKCYQMRLKETFGQCQELGFDYFTTTLTISPHKNSSIINEIGQRVGKDKFLQRDFKKKDGFRVTQELSKKYGIYHQNYCGCVYSQRI